MIRKSGYLLLAILSYGIFESLLLGYPYYIALSVILSIMILEPSSTDSSSDGGSMIDFSILNSSSLVG